MSVHGFSEDESQQLERGKQSSSLESAIGAEGNQAFYFQFIADKEDGAFGELDGNHPRTRRARSLTKKKEKGIKLIYCWRGGKGPLIVYFTELVIRLLLDKYLINFLICLSHHEEYFESLDAEKQQHKEGWFDDLDQGLFNFKHRVHCWLKEATKKSLRGSRCNHSNKRSNSSRSSAKLIIINEATRGKGQECRTRSRSNIDDGTAKG